MLQIVRSPSQPRRRQLSPLRFPTELLALYGGLAIVLAASGYSFAGMAGFATAVAAIAALVLLAPRLSSQATISRYGARLMPPDDSQLSSLVDVLAWRAGLDRRPDLYIVPSLTLMAFSTMPDTAPRIAVSEGLLRRLSLRQIAGVLAHEMAHIRKGDLALFAHADGITRIAQAISLVAVALASANAMLYAMGREPLPWLGILILYLAPLISSFIQLSLSRRREFEADRIAVEITGDPNGMASAVDRMEVGTGHFWEDLIPPLARRRVPEPSLLRTHPLPAERMERLLSPSWRPKTEPLVIVERPMLSLVGVGPTALRPRYRWPGVWY